MDRVPGDNSQSLPATPKLNSQTNIDFPHHCKIFDHHMKIVNLQFEKIKECVLDLYREVTSKKCVSGYQRIEAIVLDCADIKSEIDTVDGLLERGRADFKKKWECELYRIHLEQRIYQNQVSDLTSLKEDLSRLLKIAQQIEPFLRSSQQRSEDASQGQVRSDQKTPNHSRKERLESKGYAPPAKDPRQSQPVTVADPDLENNHASTLARHQSKSLPRRSKSDYLSAGQVPPYEEKNTFLWECDHPKPGLLSSILDKVCLKNEHSLECLPWRTEAMSYKSCSDNLKYEKDSNRRSQENLDFVQKPYEPPCLGKSSRITPVKTGNEELPTGVKPLKYSDSVEVLSVIRYNKMKNGNTTPSPVNFDSGSDLDSIYGQQHENEAKIEFHQNEELKYRTQRRRELSRSMSMSHPPGEVDDRRDGGNKADRKFYSLGRTQDKFSPVEKKTDCSDPTDLRNLHGGAEDQSDSSLPKPPTRNQSQYQQQVPTGQFKQKLSEPVQSENHYSESKKISPRNIELISQLLNPENRDQSQQLNILSQLLQSDLSRFKSLGTDHEVFQEGPLRSRSQQSDSNSQASDPSRGCQGPAAAAADDQRHHSNDCQLSRHVNEPKEESRRPDCDPPRRGDVFQGKPDSYHNKADLIQQLLQADIHQSGLKRSDLLEQLIGYDEGRAVREPTADSGRTAQEPASILTYEESRRTIKEKGYWSGKTPELKKRDSFEGHELAVECLVNAVQECRKAGTKIRKKED